MYYTLTELQERAWDAIRKAKKGQEITARNVARIINLEVKRPEDFNKGLAMMQAIIHALRVKGYPVCANGKGYYPGTTEQEIREYAQSLQGRIDKMQEAVVGIRGSKPYIQPAEAEQKSLL